MLKDLSNIAQNGLKCSISISGWTSIIDHEDGESELEEDLGPMLETGWAHLVRASVNINDLLIKELQV